MTSKQRFDAWLGIWTIVAGPEVGDLNPGREVRFSVTKVGLANSERKRVRIDSSFRAVIDMVTEMPDGRLLLSVTHIPPTGIMFASGVEKLFARMLSSSTTRNRLCFSKVIYYPELHT